jgi:hypothetical protein
MADIDFGGLLRQIGDDLQSGQRATQGTPSAIQEYMYWQNLPKPEQDRYLTVKRAQQPVNLGGNIGILDPSGGGGLSGLIPVTPKPEDMPGFRKDVAAATAAGTEVGKTAGAEEKKYLQAPQIAELVQEARALLPQATSGGLASDLKGVQEYFGSTTDSSGIDSSLSVLGAKLTSNVPRYEGPQSDKDTAEYKVAAGEVANSRKPAAARMAALDTIEKLNNKYLMKEYAPAAGGSDGQQPAPQETKTVGGNTYVKINGEWHQQ